MRQSDFTITLPHCFISLYYQFFQQDSQDLCCSSLLILLIDGEESHVHLVHIWSRATGANHAHTAPLARSFSTTVTEK